MTISGPDGELAGRVAAGDRVAVAALVRRDHGVAELLARLAAREQPGDAVVCAWRWLLGEAVPRSGTARSGTARSGTARSGTDDLRGALLAAVHRILAERGQLAGQTEPGEDEWPDERSADERFCAGDDRWAGWWAGDGPPPWLADTRPAPAQVERALRRLPLSLRLLLVLHDVARVDAGVTAGITGLDQDRQARLLGLARDRYVQQMQVELAGQEAV